jgi:hypothetical protein
MSGSAAREQLTGTQVSADARGGRARDAAVVTKKPHDALEQTPALSRHAKLPQYPMTTVAVSHRVLAEPLILPLEAV